MSWIKQGLELLVLLQGWIPLEVLTDPLKQLVLLAAFWQCNGNGQVFKFIFSL